MNAKFHPANITVPSRLSGKTRSLASLYLTTDTIKKSMLKSEFTFEAKDSLHKTYSENIRLIAENSPLRIIPGEKLAGSAVYIEAAHHACPGGKFAATSHTTLGFERGVKLGLRGLEKEITDSKSIKGRTADELDFLDSMLSCIDSIRIWRDRHVRLISEMEKSAAGDELKELSELKNLLLKVPENTPETFPEAVQSLWFLYVFQRLCGNWPGLGRLDVMLGSYLKNDMESGRITLDEAREYLAHFWIKGTEWKGSDMYGGDAQHYQNVIIGGTDADGSDVTNEVSYLILDIVEELHISDFPVAVRIGGKTSERMFRRIAEVQRLGGGIVSIYNEPLVLDALEKFGYDRREASEFTNDGCWEVILPGKTAFTYWPFDALQLLQNVLGIPEGMEIPDFKNIGSIIEAWGNAVREHVGNQNEIVANYFKDECRESREANANVSPTPTALLSILVENCIAAARSYNNRGAKYNVAAIHAGGLPDVANSLLALKKIVFDENRISFREFVLILRANWKGHEELRLEAASKTVCFGNDSDEADAILKRITEDYALIAGETHDVNGILRPVGISTFGRELAYAPQRMATAFGRFAGEVLAPNLAPTPQTDVSGPTAVVKSHCKVDFRMIPNGCPLDLKFHPSALKGESGLNALSALLKTFISCGGFYLQVDAVDADVLRDAQSHPENYPNLSVRISGWSARFTTLDRKWQDMIIARTEHRI